MRSIFLLLSIIGFIGLSSNVIAQECNQQNPGCITNVDIFDGAVTNVKISGPIDAEKVQQLPNVVTVAKGVQGFGTYSTITGALADITPSITTPYLINVMPGTYEEGTITMKSYVALKGAGREVTIIDTGSSSTFLNFSGTVNNSISGFELWTKIVCSACENLTVSDNFIWGYSGVTGVEIDSGTSNYYIHDNIMWDMSKSIEISTGTGNYYIRDNVITGGNPAIEFQGDNGIGHISGNHISDLMNYGIGLWYSSGKYYVSNNIVEDCQNCISMYLNDGATADIANNIVKKHSTYTGGGAISMYEYGTVRISGNKIYGAGHSGDQGIALTSLASSAKVVVETNNTDEVGYGLSYGSSFNGSVLAKGNKVSGSSTADIRNPPASGAIHSYNIYDSVSGGTVAGAYNSKSDGTPW